ALSAPRAQPQQRETLWGEHEQQPSDQDAVIILDAQESRLVKVVNYVHEQGFITNSLYRELTGVSDRTAARDLETLVERGRLRSMGKRRARRYVLP
ncbi:MAG: DeoR family transcriptional regulator, partial [Chloroflexota bacterium]|nr:DeoR family transcriptional regulator [Chloroflexota bacterium]